MRMVKHRGYPLTRVVVGPATRSAQSAAFEPSRRRTTPSADDHGNSTPRTQG